MIEDRNIDIIILFWGGELLIEIFEYLDFIKWIVKWVFGYFDISVFLLVIIFNIGIVMVYGINFVDLCGEYWDLMIVMW